MARKKTNLLTGIGGKFNPALATAFLNLARGNGVTMHEALRRVMTQAVIDQALPGIATLDLEARERDKWGKAATPVFDGEENQSHTGSSAAAPSTRTPRS